MDSYRVADARKLLGKAASPDVVVVAGGTEETRAVRKAMRDLVPRLNPTPELGHDPRRLGPRRQLVPATDPYRARFGEEPTDYASTAYACTQIILASLEASAKGGPSADQLREVVRVHAVDPSNRYDTVLGTLGFEENGDSTQQVISFYRVDPEGADGAGDWALIKQQDFGPQPS